MPYHNSGDYNRPPPHYSNYTPSLPPYSNGSHWDHNYNYPYGMASYPPPPPPRRDEATTARRLSDRISGYASGADQSMEPAFVLAAAAGLPPKPVASLLDLGPGPGPGSGGRRGGRGGPPPPPPPDAKEDPRAAAGKKVSYYDMDLVAEGDVELTY